MTVAEKTAVAVAERVERLRAVAERGAFDAIVATSPASIYYLTGFDGLQLERLFAVAVTVGGSGGLIVPALDEDAAVAAPTSLPAVAYGPASDGMSELVDALGDATRVGVEEDHLNFARAQELTSRGKQLAPAGGRLLELRSVKDALEVARIREACGVIGGVLERMFAELRPGDVEREVNAKVAFWLAESGATDSHPLVLFGPNAANPHAAPGDRTLEVGDVICADVSARIAGYWGDLTRCGTVGPPSDWARRAWAVVRDAQAAAIAAARPGVAASDVDRAQLAIIEAAGDLGRALHGAGHAIGAEIHEPPFLVPRTTAPLREGVVLTIEPGLYRTSVGGIRLEDDVLVAADGPEVLPGPALELREVPA